MTLTPEQARHAAEMYTALAEGKECQARFINESTQHPWDGGSYLPRVYTYRVKPEPEPVVNEWWACLTAAGHIMSACNTKAAAECYVHSSRLSKEVVRVVRADSIKIAELVTDEQLEMAHWTVRWGTHSAPLPSFLRKFVEALDAVREGK